MKMSCKRLAILSRPSDVIDNKLLQKIADTYHGYAMREVSMISTALFETNLFSLKGFVCSFSHYSHIYWFLPEEIKCVSQYIGKNKWISEFRRKKSQELQYWSSFCVNYFLRYHIMMQHQPIMKRVNGAHEWAHRPYQFLITADCTNTGRKMKGSHHRAADRCPFVHRHS